MRPGSTMAHGSASIFGFRQQFMRFFGSDAIDDPKFHVFETVILSKKHFELSNEIGVQVTQRLDAGVGMGVNAHAQ